MAWRLMVITVAAMKCGSRITTLMGFRSRRASSTMRTTSFSAWPRLSWRAIGQCSPSSSTISSRHAPSPSCSIEYDQPVGSACTASVPSRPRLAEGVDAVPKQPLAAGAMQILQVRSRDDHAVQQLLHFSCRLLLDVRNLAAVPEPGGAVDQKLPQRVGLLAAQNRPELGGIRGLAGRGH